jgi:hypothetical protein
MKPKRDRNAEALVDRRFHQRVVPSKRRELVLEAELRDQYPGNLDVPMTETWGLGCFDLLKRGVK